MQTIFHCIVLAANLYSVPPAALYSIAQVESSGNPLAVNHNSNGTTDYGLMQINSIWFKKLKSVGFDTEKVKTDACTSAKAGAYILNQTLQESHGDLWKALGYYHSHNPEYMRRYQAKLWRSMQKIRTEQVNNHRHKTVVEHVHYIPIGDLPDE